MHAEGFRATSIRQEIAVIAQKEKVKRYQNIFCLQFLFWGQ
jgi:hypothetical protein